MIAPIARRRWLVLVLAAVGVLVAAEVGVQLFLPRDGILPPDDVAASSFFTPAQLERAQEYRGPQVAIHVAQTLLGLLVLALLVARPPRWLRDPAAATRRVLLRVALTAAGVSLLLALVALPLRAVSRVRGMDVGLITRSWPGWMGDVVLSAAIQALQMAVVAVVLVAAMRRFPRSWWVVGSGFTAAAAVVVLLLTPLVVDPLFNRFTPLRGPLRADVVRLAERAGVRVDDVYVMDASRRTTAANAYVTGIGGSKRVVLYDNLVADYPRDEVRFVVAHELAHERHDDVRDALLYVLFVAPWCLLAIAVAVPRLASYGGGTRGGGADPTGGEPATRAAGTPRPDARTVPALALAFAFVVPAVTTVSNQLSRRVEARADTVALQLTDAPDGLAGFRRRSVVRNVVDPDPGRLGHVLFGTHPTALERLGAAEAWRRGVRPQRPTVGRPPRG